MSGIRLGTLPTHRVQIAVPAHQQQSPVQQSSPQPPPPQQQRYHSSMMPRRRFPGSSTFSSSFSTTRSQQQPSVAVVAMTLRLLLVSLAVVALFIMIFNLSFAYTQLVNHYSNIHKIPMDSPSNNYKDPPQESHNHDQYAAWRLSQGRYRHPKWWQRQQPEQLQQQQQQRWEAIIPISQNDVLHKNNKKKKKDCQEIASIRGMLQCYRPEFVQQLKQELKRLPKHCVRSRSRRQSPTVARATPNQNQIWSSNTTTTKIRSNPYDDNEDSFDDVDDYLIHNWTQFQSCLSFVRTHEPPQQQEQSLIHTIHILGERHSGTKFVQQELQRCFPRTTQFRIHRDLERSKHFFQPLPMTTTNNNVTTTKSTTHSSPSSSSSQGLDYRHSLIIAVFRDPLDWIEAMRLKPYHAPFHMKGFVPTTPSEDEDNKKKNNDIITQQNNNRIEPLDWKSFVTRPWTMPRDHRYDLAATTETESTRQQQPLTAANPISNFSCRYGFAPHEIIPCWFNPQSNLVPDNRIRGFEPIYELQRSGILRRATSSSQESSSSSRLEQQQPPFADIFQLRAEKIRHLALEIPLLLPNLGGYVPVRYEDLLQQGMEPLIHWISTRLQIPSQCALSSSSQSQQSQTTTNMKKKRKKPTGPQLDLLNARQARMPPEQKEWIQSHLFVPMEQLLGYFETIPEEEEEDNNK